MFYVTDNLSCQTLYDTSLHFVTNVLYFKRLYNRLHLKLSKEVYFIIIILI